jgi:hypothetical protein
MYWLTPGQTYINHELIIQQSLPSRIHLSGSHCLRHLGDRGEIELTKNLPPLDRNFSSSFELLVLPF